jgi:hypothetical protein
MYLTEGATCATINFVPPLSRASRTSSSSCTSFVVFSFFGAEASKAIVFRSMFFFVRITRCFLALGITLKVSTVGRQRRLPVTAIVMILSFVPIFSIIQFCDAFRFGRGNVMFLEVLRSMTIRLRWEAAADTMFAIQRDRKGIKYIELIGCCYETATKLIPSYFSRTGL